MGSTSQIATKMGDAGAWDESSEGYASFANWTLQYGKHALAQLTLRAGDRLLEVACGPGLLAMHAAKHLDVSVHAVDFSQGMISALQQLQRSTETKVDVTACVMDGTALEYADASFDATASVFGVFLFPDYKRGLAEMLRVTRPGGQSVVVAWAEHECSPIGPWIALMQRDFPEGLPWPEQPGARAMQTTEGMIAALEVAGFCNVSALEHVASMVVMDPEVFVKSAEQNPFFQEIRPRFSEERWQALFEVMPLFIRQKYPQEDGGFVFRATAIIGIGQR
jgi:SAM-dependent methyltransferase